METPPPPDATTTPVAPPERRCPRCGSTLAPEQEWCLACGAAAGTEVVESRGWRVPIYLGGGLVALAILGVILAIAALSNQEQQTAGTPTPSPGASAAPPGATPTPAVTPIPSATVTPSPTTDPGTGITPDPTTDPSTEVTPDPTTDPSTEVTPDPTTDSGSSGTFSGWEGQDGDYTVIIESADSLERAEEVAQQAQDSGHTVGILDSDDFSNLNGGYQVVFSGSYSSESEAEDALGDLKSDYPDAYVRRIGNS